MNSSIVYCLHDFEYSCNFEALEVYSVSESHPPLSQERPHINQTQLKFSDEIEPKGSIRSFFNWFQLRCFKHWKPFFLIYSKLIVSIYSIYHQSAFCNCVFTVVPTKKKRFTHSSNKNDCFWYCHQLKHLPYQISKFIFHMLI